MAHSSHRTWKGCPMCKSHKDTKNGDAIRMPWAVLRKMGKKSRVNRHDVEDY